jgi:hypothetical protein
MKQMKQADHYCVLCGGLVCEVKAFQQKYMPILREKKRWLGLGLFDGLENLPELLLLSPLQ